MIIWLASYPRSGNTFLRVILNKAFGLKTYSIYNDRFDIASESETESVVGHEMLPHEFDIDQARKSSSIYAIKTHEWVPEPTDKVIYLVRDGRECAVSYANYIRTYHDERCTVQDVLYGNVRFGTWGEHLCRWNPLKRASTLVLKFENITAEPQAYLQPISDFIGVKIASQEIPDFEKLHQINPKFFRKGKSDSWKKILSQQQQLTFWLLNHAQMSEYYPDEAAPEFFEDLSKCSILGELLSSQNEFFREKLAEQSQEQERQRREYQAQLDKVNASLQARAKELRSIRSAIDGVVEKKAVTAPFKKYRAYRDLLAMYRG